MTPRDLRRRDATLADRFGEIDWGPAALVAALAACGLAMLYSAAGGAFDSWTQRQAIRFAALAAFMVGVALIDLRVWIRHAYTIYAFSLALLVAVEAMGIVGMGAQRWIDLGVFRLQPSETMKIALVLALARYFHGVTLEDIGRIRFLIAPLLLIAAPAALVLRQPDLGTAAVLVLGGIAVMFAAGVRWWKFAAAAAAAAAAAPIAWSAMHDYQRRRVLTFLDPSNDPLGAGYHILQSKIAMGSGGLFGRGFLAGTQSHLSFLPEQRTDFIFTMLAEEFGLVGAGGVLLLYAALFAYGMAIALRARSQFGRLLALGVTVTLFLYVFVNVAMVTGLIPVVGVPLPLLSYGGTAMLTAMCGVGLLMAVWIDRDAAFGRGAALDRRWGGRSPGLTG